MKHGHIARLVLVAIGLGFVSGVSAAGDSDSPQPQTFSVDPTHSTAIFRVRHGVGPFYGRFNDVQGTIRFDGDANLSLDIAIMVESVDTGNERLDGHLKSPDFFNAKEFPKLTFKSRTAKKGKGKSYTVTGDIAMHGVSRPITINVEWLGTAKGQRGKRCGFEAIFSIKRSEFGITMGVDEGFLGDDVKVIVGLEAIAAEPK